MKKVIPLLALVLATAALVACGDDEGTTTITADEAGGGAATKASGEKARRGRATLKFEADPNGALTYTTKVVTTKEGKVKVEFTNPQSVPHDIAFQDPSGLVAGKTKVITDGSTSITVDLLSGHYDFYCTVPGHREAGMEGRVNVD